MDQLVRRLRFFPVPLGAALFLTLWLWAESGRGNLGAGVILLFAASIAIAQWFWKAAMSGIVAAVAASAVGVLHPLGSTDWPANLGIPLTVAVAVAFAPAVARLRILVIGLVVVIGATSVMVFQTDGWISWTGGGYPVLGLYSHGDVVFVDWASLSVFGAALVVAAWFAGRLWFQVRSALVSQREELEHRLELSEVELALAEERNRIAQDMHDVLAHSLAVIVAQADGARYLRKSRPAAVDSALLSIADAARSALVDVRGMIDGMLDGTEPPQPGLDDLDDLVASVRASGIEVRMTQAGDALELAPGRQAAVYRIIQEGLTNSLRHRGRGSSVSLVLDWRGPGLSIQLVSIGEGECSDNDTSGGGRGLPGMEQRARLAGGWLAAGVDETGDHRVTAFVPFGPIVAREPDAVLDVVPDDAPEELVSA